MIRGTHKMYYCVLRCLSFCFLLRYNLYTVKCLDLKVATQCSISVDKFYVYIPHICMKTQNISVTPECFVIPLTSQSPPSHHHQKATIDFYFYHWLLLHILEFLTHWIIIQSQYSLAFSFSIVFLKLIHSYLYQYFILFHHEVILYEHIKV